MPPIGVVVPRTAEAAVAAIKTCGEFNAPVLSRGGGTSLAGQCCNEAVVLDWTKTGYPDIPRRVSGYNLDHLLPEKQFHVARALVGSESTLVTVLTAEISLVEIPKWRSLVVLGYPDIAQAADVVPLVVRHRPLACEGLDDVLISLEREEHLGGAALDKLPEGSGWLMIRFGGDTEQEARQRAEELIAAAQSEGEWCAGTWSPATGIRRRSATRWTCAWPARAAARNARSASTWLPTRPSSSCTTTPEGSAPRRTTRWAGCRSSPGW